MRHMIVKDKVRSDGRKTNEIRLIDIEQSLLPRVHGSSLFTRGETQAMSVCTLGGESMGQRYEDLDGESLLNVAIEEALKQRCGNCAFYGHDSRCFQSDVVVKHRCTPWVEKDYRCKFWKEDTEVFYKGCRIKIMYNTYNSLWYATITNETAWKIELNAKIKEDALENAKTFIDNLGVIDE